MGGFQELLQQGAASAWLFIPTAVLLGALHGLEPGHSKTMMAAFIVAIRGTVAQAALLGLAATISHTAVVWAVALVGMSVGAQWASADGEPYFQLASAALIVGVALWMLVRLRRERRHQNPPHGHHHPHDTAHRIDTGHGIAVLSIFEDGVPPRFRLRFERPARAFPAPHAAIKTRRPDGTRQHFAFADRGACLESVDAIAEPHEFVARLRLGPAGHRHEYDVTFSEQPHGHGLELTGPGPLDSHDRAHAADIRRRFADRHVTTGQIVLFGLTGGLIPCPAAITVLLLCLQLGEITLGIALVLCFSIGLAAVMIATGALAALGVRHMTERWKGLGTLMRRAPYVSCGLVLLIGLYVGWDGASRLD